MFPGFQMASKAVRILGWSGSLRAASWNTASLRFAASVMPKNASLTIVDWAGAGMHALSTGGVGVGGGATGGVRI
jgi:hypothetical protein